MIKEEPIVNITSEETDPHGSPVGVETPTGGIDPEEMPNQPFVIDELLRVIRPLGQKENLPITYGFALWRGTTQVLTATSKINPIAGIVPVSAAGAITLTSNPNILPGVTGQLLILEGTSNTNTVTLTDGNGIKLSGAITLGIRDTLTLMYNGTYFVELSRSNNS